MSGYFGATEMANNRRVVGVEAGGESLRRVMRMDVSIPFPVVPGSTTGCERRPWCGQDYDTVVVVVAGASFQWCNTVPCR